jgi:L-fuconolactonase
MPWDREYAEVRRAFLMWRDAVTPERAIGAMDAVGVDAALLTSFFLYKDVQYLLDAARMAPNRFAVVVQIDLHGPDPAGEVARLGAAPEVLAVRIVFPASDDLLFRRLVARELNDVFSAANEVGVPVMITIGGRAFAIRKAAEDHPSLPIVIDHLGVVQGAHNDAPVEPFRQLKDVFDLHDVPNVYVKLSGAPTLSSRPFPFDDLDEPIRELVDTFGAERVLWGSDFTRTRPHHTYAEALGFLQSSRFLTQTEKDWLLGGSLQKLTGWPEKHLPD